MKTKILFLLLIILQFNLAKAQMDDKFYYPEKKLKPIEWANTEEVKLAVENDTITAVILKPAQKPKATIFYFHGAGGNLSYYAPIITPLVKDNFQVVLVDFRGYGKSTGKPLHKNIAEDGEKFFVELSKKDGIKNNKKVIYGASIGTQIATLLAKNHQDEISGLVLEGAMASFGDIAAFYSPEFKDFLLNSYISPYSAKEDIKLIHQIPKLFIHSKEDKDVPFAQGVTVFTNASEPKQFLEFSGEHLFALKYESAKILESINKMVVGKKNKK